jgi:hypothetical protein
MANAPTARPFRIEVPGLRARTAATRRGAEVALGQMMTQVANGTEGRIVKGAETILVGVAETLGWSTRFEAGTRVRTIRHVAVVEMLEGELAGRRLDSYLTHLTPVPMFETIAEFAFAVEAAAGAELGRLFA